MSVNKPYHRNYRPFIEDKNPAFNSSAYIIDRHYAKKPKSFIRVFLLILEDLKRIIEFIEPSEDSLNTHSIRIHQLFMRTCIEIEANFKAILNENIYTPQLDRFKNPIFNMSVYKKINFTHHLSSYKVGLPLDSGELMDFLPFSAWANQGSIPWYQAYNQSKHDRVENFQYANFGNLLNAISGLLIVLSSQFKTEDFSSGNIGLTIGGGNYYEMETSIGEFFRIQFPDDWSNEEKYYFNWSELKQEEIRFQKINFDEIE